MTQFRKNILLLDGVVGSRWWRREEAVARAFLLSPFPFKTNRWEWLSGWKCYINPKRDKREKKIRGARLVYCLEEIIEREKGVKTWDLRLGGSVNLGKKSRSQEKVTTIKSLCDGKQLSFLKMLRCDDLKTCLTYSTKMWRNFRPHI